MNWGIKIVIGMSLFMMFIVSSVIYMVSKDTDSLEDTDYYEKGLNFNEEYNRKVNSLRDKAEPNIRITNDTLYIDFTKTVNKGILLFKRLSDGSQDKKLPFQTRSTGYHLPISTFQSGRWRLEIWWESNGVEYISKHNLNYKL